MRKWQCRIAPSLGGGFAGHPNKVWGTLPYTYDDVPTVFFGMYGMQDIQALMAHKGEKAILWAGSDIRNLVNGYWLDKKGEYRLSNIPRILREADHYVENQVEAIALESVGLEPQIIPSFLGEVAEFPVQNIYNKLCYYTSVSGDDFELYGWDEINDWAKRHPDVEFHLYGNEAKLPIRRENVYVHGRLSQMEMDEQIRYMTGALRLTRFDGFSEILAKSVLWGQHPVSPYIHYPFIAKHIGEKVYGRNQLLDIVNKYPWAQNNT